jgi:hypothetical protein
MPSDSFPCSLAVWLAGVSCRVISTLIIQEIKAICDGVAGRVMSGSFFPWSMCRDQIRIRASIIEPSQLAKSCSASPKS